MGQPDPRWTIEEFLAWEETQPERHEFIRGEVFAMVGARRVHGTVSGNVFAMLRSQLRGTPCRAFVESMKLQVADDTVFYPDVFVTCDPADLRTEQVFRSPTVIVEVLSPSTESIDRGLKFAHYRRLASVQEYLLVDPDQRTVELYRRGSEGLFTLHEPGEAREITLTSIGCTLALDEVFEGLDQG